MSDAERFPPCKHCGHFAESHDEKFGDCLHEDTTTGQYGECECPGYEEGEWPMATEVVQ